jgi:hypothetical protein
MSPSLADTRWNTLEAVHDGRAHEVMGTIYEAAEAAGVKPGTIRVWMSRGKLQPLFGEPGEEFFHIPTVVDIAEAGRGRNVPKDPAANARGPHRRRTELRDAA